MSQQQTEQNMTAIRCAARFCNTMRSADTMERDEFLRETAASLAELYLFFVSLPENNGLPGNMFAPQRMDYVDEDFYNAIRLKAEIQLGPDDTYLETFEEDMKYSDTPVGASVSESLADIFQPVFNFLCSVRESDGDTLAEDIADCKEKFDEYWSQTLVNVMRPINKLLHHPN